MTGLGPAEVDVALLASPVTVAVTVLLLGVAATEIRALNPTPQLPAARLAAQRDGHVSALTEGDEQRHRPR